MGSGVTFVPAFVVWKLLCRKKLKFVLQAIHIQGKMSRGFEYYVVSQYKDMVI